MELTGRERDNILRWDGRPGWYEVYYLKWNDLASRTAFWVRYTMTSPLPGKGDPCCELWGIFFDADDPAKNFAVKDRLPIRALSWERDFFRVGVGEAELRMNSCRGAIGGPGPGNSLAWEIEFDSEGGSFRHFPYGFMYESAFPKTKVLSPHEDCRFSGRVEANGREIVFDGAPGQQTHIWGTKHALRWAWGHCNAFEEEAALWEGLDSQIMLGPFPSPHLSIFYLRYRGISYYFNTVKSLFTNQSRWEPGLWRFEARCRELRMAGVISCDPSEVVAVTYTDPDGEKAWCNNSKVASIKLVLSGAGGEHLGELTSAGACAAEFVDRAPWGEVPVRI